MVYTCGKLQDNKYLCHDAVTGLLYEDILQDHVHCYQKLENLKNLNAHNMNPVVRDMMKMLYHQMAHVKQDIQ